MALPTPVNSKVESSPKLALKQKDTGAKILGYEEQSQDGKLRKKHAANS